MIQVDNTHVDLFAAPDRSDLGSVHGSELASGDMATGVFRTLCSSGLADPPPERLALTSNVVSSRMCQVYLDQVDPVVKILHRPSLCRLMQHGGKYLEYPDGHPSTLLLSASVCYAAVCSMADHQVNAILQVSKTSAVAELRAACEAALEKSTVLVTTEITVLQAFILYIVRVPCFLLYAVIASV